MKAIISPPPGLRRPFSLFPPPMAFESPPRRTPRTARSIAALAALAALVGGPVFAQDASRLPRSTRTP